MRYYNRIGYGVGVIPMTPQQGMDMAQQGVSFLKDIVGMFSGLFDKSPNYPIKSANTEKKLKAEVNANIPFPSSVAEARELIKKANQLIELNNKRDNSKRVIDTIQIMYREAIAVLEQYIATGGNLPGTGTMVPGGGGSNVPYYPSQPISQSGGSGITSTHLLIGAAAIAALYFATKTNRR